LAKAVANESDSNFISIKGPELFSKWVGESEKAVREVFSKARQVAPCIVFIDEIDSIAPRRGQHMGDSGVGDRVVNQLLSELDGVEGLEGVTIIAATNRPDMIDPAVLRPGRIDRHVFIPTPGQEARKEIFKVHTRGKPVADDVDVDWLADRTEGYVGSDIEAVCREAAMNALRRDIESNEIAEEDFADALEQVNPSAREEHIDEFRERMREAEGLAKSEDVDYLA
jgi:transitional endoplasmic reticulum ATPase